MRLVFGRRAFPVHDRRRDRQEDAGVGHAHGQPRVLAARHAGADQGAVFRVPVFIALGAIREMRVND